MDWCENYSSISWRHGLVCDVCVVCEWDCCVVVVLVDGGKCACRFKKSGVPRPVTYRAENQPTSQTKRHKSRGTNRIPFGDRRESLSAAARVGPRCDIVEACEALGIQPGIEEAERVPTS